MWHGGVHGSGVSLAEKNYVIIMTVSVQHMLRDMKGGIDRRISACKTKNLLKFFTKVITLPW